MQKHQTSPYIYDTEQNMHSKTNFKDQNQYQETIPIGQPIHNSYILAPQQYPQPHNFAQPLYQVPNLPTLYPAPHYPPAPHHLPPLQFHNGVRYQNGMQPPPPPQFQPQINVRGNNRRSLNHPMQMTCNTCRAQISTIVVNETGNTTYLWSALLCCVCWPLTCLPCVLDVCLDKSHYCPNCGTLLVRKHQQCCECFS